MKQEVFRMERVTYSEDGNTLLEDFNLNIFAGEIMGLIPVSGHGMQAFITLLKSNLPLEDGYVYYREKMVNSWRDSKRNHNRISVIQDKSCLVEGLTVADNIFVIRQGFSQKVIQPGLLERQLAPFLAEIEVKISADEYVEKLSVFKRVVVELLRAVVAEHRLIVLSEISTIVGDAELQELYRIMRHYAAKGFSFLYISPHFEEILQICDRAAIMLNGRIEKIIYSDEMLREILIDYTKEYDKLVRMHLEEKEGQYEQTQPVFEARAVSGQYINQFNFSIQKGECLVIQSLNNRIFHDILDMITGEEELSGGRILIAGREEKIRRNRNISIVQELPTVSMIFPEMSYLDNLCFGLDHRLKTVWLKKGIKSSIMQEYGPTLGDEIFDRPIDELSERQKYQLVYLRVLLQKPKIVFCVQPFKGADLSHRKYIWELLEMILKKGIAVVILAVNLADSLSLADRLIRIDRESQVEEYLQKDFATIPIVAPWLYLYQERQADGEDQADGGHKESDGT